MQSPTVLKFDSRDRISRPLDYDPFLDPEIAFSCLPRLPYLETMKMIREKSDVAFEQQCTRGESLVTWRESDEWTGYAVVIGTDRRQFMELKPVDRRSFDDFWFSNLDLLKENFDYGVGTWIDPEFYKIEIACVWVTQSLPAAIERAMSEGEPVYWDIAQRRFDLTSGSD